MESRIIQWDCLGVMSGMETDSVDLICTDPPYGYSFMGKDWDKAVPSVEIWKECLRVLKPGAFAFVMSAPRQDVLSQMIVRLTEAGFDTHFTSLYWTYASGFPKAMNIGKMVDKRMGVKRKVIGESKRHGGGSSEIFEERGNQPITAPASPEAKALDGSYGGFQPKPAVEVIIVAMKPLSEKTYVDQALKNGKGITWLDNCRIPAAVGDKPDFPDGEYGTDTAVGAIRPVKRDADKNPTGRFMANLLVSDDILNDGKERKAGTAIRRNVGHSKGANIHYAEGSQDAEMREDVGFGDTGSYSRFFSLDQWWNALVDKNPKAYNTEVCLQEENLGLKRSLDPADNAEKNSPTTPATELDDGSVLDLAGRSFASGKTNPDVKSAEEKPDSTATVSVPSPAPTKPAMGTSEETSNISESESTTPIAPSELTQFDQTTANSVDGVLNALSDIILTWKSQLTSSGSVSRVIIEQMQQEISLDPRWQNFVSLPESVRKTFPFLVCAKASKREKNEGLDDFPDKASDIQHGTIGRAVSVEKRREAQDGKNAATMKNTHATVKPLQLMSYLVALGSRPGDVVLDPFVGSGTTVCAAKALGRIGIGIEREKEYFDIAQARLNATQGPMEKS